MSRFPALFWLAALVNTMSAVGVFAQGDSIRLAESFESGKRYQAELSVEMAGQISMPGEKDKPAKSVRMQGASTIRYAERVMPPDDDRSAKVVRQYRELNFLRTIGDRE